MLPPRLFEPTKGVHATGGGIGQGMPMAIGAAVGAQSSDSGRRCYVDLVTPDYALLCQSIGLQHQCIQDLAQVGAH